MTLSPLLSAQDADTVALDLGVFIAEKARTYRTSQEAIIAALRPYIAPQAPASEPPPSQPEQASSHAPAVDAPAVPPASEATDGEEASSSLPSSPSVTNETTGDAKFRDQNDWEDEDGPLVEALVSLPSTRLRPEPEEAPRPRRPAPNVRFHLRDKGGRYLHQSLTVSPTDKGPLMTVNRVYAWFGTIAQFNAAMKQWPEIEHLRQEGPNS